MEITDDDNFLAPVNADDYLRRRREDPDGDTRYIIPGLLHRKLTVEHGLATGGKSTWTYNLVNAYLAGDGEFMGQPVHVPGGPKRVAFICTDDDGADDAADAMEFFGVADQVGVYELPPHQRGRAVEEWYAGAQTLVEAGYGLVVVDNNAGLLSDDATTNDDAAARAVISRMRVMVQAGLTVVLLCHSNNNGTFGGAQEWRKVARCIYGIHGRVPSNTRTVRTQNNTNNLPEFRVRLEGDGPKLVMVGGPTLVSDAGATAQQDRSRSKSKDQERLDFILSRDDWVSQEQVADALGVAGSTVSRLLRKRGYEFRGTEVVRAEAVAA